MTDNFLAEAVDLIRPTPAQADECRSNITYAIAGIANALHLREQQTTAAMRRTFEQLDVLAQRMEAELRNLPDIVSSHIFDRDDLGKPIGREHFIGELHKIREAAALLAPPDRRRGLQSAPAAPRPDPVKRIAAQEAWRLIEEYSGSRPTLTVPGAYIDLAALLYGAGTGERTTSNALDRACRVVADERRKNRDRTSVR